MENVVGVRRSLVSNTGETSPDRARIGYRKLQQQQHNYHQQQRFIKPLNKVQVIYYLCKVNGQLEHPHFMELTCISNQQLHLKDVIDRLTVLRGKGLPCLYSWSCKRRYKNGYVWHDLAENDIIFPADGIEYVLKGSEIIAGATDHLRQLSSSNTNLAIQQRRNQQLEFKEEIEEDELKGQLKDASNHTAGATYTRSNCYIGSLNDLDRTKNRFIVRSVLSDPTDVHLDDISPPSSSSSDKPPVRTGIKVKPVNHRFEDNEPMTEPCSNRNSFLFQLITCGSTVLKGRSSGLGRSCNGVVNTAAVDVAVDAVSGRRSHASVSGPAGRAVNRSSDEVESHRYGVPRVEDKEYFSGSIVEMSRGPDQPSHKKSSSYKEERSTKA